MGTGEHSRHKEHEEMRDISSPHSFMGISVRKIPLDLHIGGKKIHYMQTFTKQHIVLMIIPTDEKPAGSVWGWGVRGGS